MKSNNASPARLFLLSFCTALCVTLSPGAQAADEEKQKDKSTESDQQKGKAKAAEHRSVFEPARQGTRGKSNISEDPKAAQGATEGQPSLLEESDSSANAKKERADKAAQKKRQKTAEKK